MPDSLVAQCRMPKGGVHELHVLDLSEGGCMIDKRLLRMEVGERVLLKMHGLSYQTAHVVWVEEGEAGLAFEQPLYGPVIEHLKRQLSDRASAASQPEQAGYNEAPARISI